MCRWCMQPLPDWSEIWPVHPGVYLFWGYPINKNANQIPRLLLVTVERDSETFGPIYRTARSTLKKATGAAGYFMPLLVPQVFPEQAMLDAESDLRLEEASKLKVKKLKKRLSKEF